MKEIDAVRAVILDLLKRSQQAALKGENPGGWSLQGFGFLRFYFSNVWRLHVWDPKFAVAHVSTIHDHLQWDFESLIVSGRLMNQRYSVIDENYEGFKLEDESHPFDRYSFARIQTGPGGFIMEKGKPCILIKTAREPEDYRRGDTYRQRAHEVHESLPERGTVTLVKRDHTNAGDVANVFWPRGQEWVSAEPRSATPQEIGEILQNAIDRWDMY